MSLSDMHNVKRVHICQVVSRSDVHNVEPVHVCQIMSLSDMLCFCHVGPNVTVRRAQC